MQFGPFSYLPVSLRALYPSPDPRPAVSAPLQERSGSSSPGRPPNEPLSLYSTPPFGRMMGRTIPRPSSPPKGNPGTPMWIPFLAGASSGATVAWLGWIFEFAAFKSGRGQSSIEAIRTTVRSGGIRALYEGAGNKAAADFFKRGVKFFVNDALIARAKDEDGQLTVGRRIACGGAAGFINTFSSHYHDQRAYVLAEQREHQKVNGINHNLRLPNAQATLRSLPTGLVYQTIFNAGFFSVSGLTDQHLRTYFGDQAVNNHPFMSKVLCGGAGGIAAASSAQATFTLRNQLWLLLAQNDNDWRKAFQMLVAEISAKPLSHWWKGLLPRYMKYFSAGAGMLYCFETYKEFLIWLESQRA